MRTLVVGILAMLGLACTTVAPRFDHTGEISGDFSHSDFDDFLKRHVDRRGRVDYAGALQDRDDLDRYIAAIAAVSPDSHPDRFESQHHELAYWINAYNASVIAIVLDHYPIESVRDVGPPALLFFMPRLSGFFFFHRIILGGDETALYNLENGLIRKRYAEPGIHFALNCAAASCPRLPPEAFIGERLEEQLERETLWFMSEGRNVRIDAADPILHISSIFDWYERDFVEWMRDHRPMHEPSLKAYVELYLPSDVSAELRECGMCKTEFIAYDWALNAQGVESMRVVD